MTIDTKKATIMSTEWFNNDNIGSTPENTDKPPVRFRVPNGESKEFTFLDAEFVTLTFDSQERQVPAPVRLSEYKVDVPKTNIESLPPQLRNEAQILLDRLFFKAGGYYNFSTVPGDVDVLRNHCKPSSIVVFSVIDHSSWTSPQGKTYVDQKRLFVMKRNSSAWGILQRTMERLRDRKGIESLRGCRFESSRHGDKTPAVGNSFEFLERVEDLSSLPDPFDYGKALKPKDQGDLERLLELLHGDHSTQPEDVNPNSWSNMAGGWGNSGGSTPQGNDPVPF